MNTPGERIKYIRTEGTGQKLSQDDFAKSIGISQEFLSQIENNKRDLTDRITIIIELKYGFRKEWTHKGIGPEKDTTPLNVTEAERELIEKGIILSRKIIKNPTLCEIAEMLVKIQPDDLRKIKTIVETFLK
ncbi:DNA-binding helix-turn-helix protein [Leptospira kirschneri str. 200801774]|uniref:helix-turn-helix domain-containing protein n=1 Tax=Leptospira kirschneri TaxID=29507 RepID=UPI0002BD30D8|nr:helix-turn-helix transcriptional regulator [Leptospira kirschneri]EMO78599.1 DNA-binding helix-turn-helix protein [Leptospira kirschneri str. 200801774]